MINKDYEKLANVLKQKVEKTFILIEASVDGLEPYDINKTYTPKELEPYDALADRFIRCVEIFIKYFKACEYRDFATNSTTLRDNLNVMEKLEMITSTTIWLNMRDVRNRIVHDYLPEQVKDMFDNIMNEFYEELEYSKLRIEGK